MKTIRIAALFTAVVAGGLIVAQCSAPPPQTDRTGRLLTMAGEEAANIPNKLDRFTRQLNIADTQLRTDRKVDAARMLGLARDTLVASSKADFDDFHRIAGWTAISQLSRAAGDRELAMKASDNALAALNDVMPITERPQYVLSLSGELADLKGKPAAIELLESGSGWAAEIKEPGTRRLALVTFAQRLIALDAFDNARNTLRRDPDAAWRTDMFLSLANQNANVMDGAYLQNNALAANSGGRGGGGAGGVAGFGARGASSVQSGSTDAAWNKDVRFESVFKQ